MYLSKIYSTIGKKGSKVKDIKERTVIQININANKNESNYYKDRNKDIEYKIMGTKLKDILIENLIIILIPLDKYEELYYNGDISKKLL